MTVVARYTPYGAIDELFAPLRAYERGDFAEMVRLGREWKETLIPGPAGCLGGESRLFNPVTGEHAPIALLCAEGKPVWVQTLNGPRLAEAPFVKGWANLYRLTTDDGNAITVTGDHKVLTRRGWTFAADLAPGMELLSGSPADAPRCSETDAGSQDRCSTYCRRCDPQPRAASKDGPAFVPSRAGVRAPARACSLAGAPASTAGCTQTCQRADRRSTADCSDPSCCAPSQADAAGAEGAVSHARGCSDSRCDGSCQQPRQSAEACRPARPSQRQGRDCGGTRQQPLRDGEPQHASGHHGCGPKSVPSAPELASCASALDTGPGSLGAALRSDAFPYPHSRGGWVRVQSLQYLRQDFYFDLHVPEEEHYLAEGLWHHNTGKSFGVAHYINALCTLFPGIRVLICRQTLKSLRQSVQVTLEEKVWGEHHPCVAGSTATREHKSSYFFPHSTNVVGGVVYSGKSEIVLGGLDKPGRTFSTEFDIVWVEEAFEISRDAWESLLRTCRNNAMPWQQMIATTNPDGRYHWLNLRASKDTVDDRGKRVMRRLKSWHWENPMLWDLERNCWTPEGIEYVQGALGHLSGPRRDRLLKGKWVSAEGLIWDSYDEDVHIVPLDSIPEPKWAIGGIDWGFRNPTSLTVWVVDKEDRIYCVREAYHTGKPLDWIAGMVQRANEYLRERWKVEMAYVVADNAEPRSIEAVNGLLRKPLYDGGGYVRGTRRKDQMAQTLLVDRAMRADLKLNGGKPSWYIADQTLMHAPDPKLVAEHRPTQLKQEVPAWVWRKTEDGRQIKDEEDPTCDAHAIDSAKYVADEVWERDLSAAVTLPKYEPGTLGAVLDHSDVEFDD